MIGLTMELYGKLEDKMIVTTHLQDCQRFGRIALFIFRVTSGQHS